MQHHSHTPTLPHSHTLRHSWEIYMTSVRVGVIGIGGMGAGHCASMDQIEEARLAAVCDIDPAAAKSASEKFGVPGVESAQELLDSGLVGAVIIATPHYFHPPYPIPALQ